MATVRLEKVTKKFGSHTALNNLDLEIRNSEFFVLLGPTGAGKTTTLRLIAGLESPNAGTIAIDGTDVLNWSAAERDVALVFQYYSLYPHYTVRQNLEFPLKSKVRHMSPQDRDARIAKAAKTLRIEHLLERKTDRLSGGEMQRVSIGRAIVREPRVFLMDEPLSNLDAELRVHMRSEIAQLHRRLGTTCIYVTHDQAEAMTMSDRIVVMMQGVALQVAPPKAIYEDPSDLRVARFVGSPAINVLPGTVAAGSGIDVLGARLPLAVGLPVGTHVTVAARPQALSLTARPAGPSLTGRLVHIENLGSDLFLHAGIEGVAAPVVVRHDPALANMPGLGDMIAIALAAGRMLVFDGQGRRLTFEPEAAAARHVHA